MRKKRSPHPLLLVFLLVILVVTLVYQIPKVKQLLSWRFEVAATYLRGVVNPVRAMPTALPQPVHTLYPSATPQPTPTLPELTSTPLPDLPSATPLPSPTSVPISVLLSAPKFVLQEPNSCGPASLAMYLEYYGWSGEQSDISKLVKPLSADRNVNVEELVYYVRTQAGWLNVEYRVGGTLSLLQELVASGIPVMIEESSFFPESFWPNDDLWAAHYLFITGYDNAAQVFIGQDSYRGPDQRISYQDVEAGWKIFNHVYILVYLPSQQELVQAILGGNWNVEINRQRALERSQAETQADAQDAFAWFNLGSNLVYFGRYAEAAAAYDSARSLGLPQRMLRYQFGPFFAYFHSGRNDDLIALTDYALQRTPNSEEALLWNGWGLYRQGETEKAIEQFRKAFRANPNNPDASYALDFVGASP